MILKYTIHEPEVDYDINPWKFTEEQMSTMRVQFKHMFLIFFANLLVYGVFLIPAFLIERAWYTVKGNQTLFYGKVKNKIRSVFDFALVRSKLSVTF